MLTACITVSVLNPIKPYMEGRRLISLISSFPNLRFLSIGRLQSDGPTCSKPPLPCPPLTHLRINPSEDSYILKWILTTPAAHSIHNLVVKYYHPTPNRLLVDFLSRVGPFAELEVSRLVLFDRVGNIIDTYTSSQCYSSPHWVRNRVTFPRCTRISLQGWIKLCSRLH